VKKHNTDVKPISVKHYRVDQTTDGEESYQALIKVSKSCYCNSLA
jgi:hypothetical protein